MALEDFTTWVVGEEIGDPLTVTANSITWNDINRNQDDTFVYKDKGAGYFSGDFTHSFKFTTPAAVDAQDGAWVYAWVLTNSVNSPTEIDAANGDLQGFFFVNAAVDTPRFALDITEDGAQYLDNSSTINFSTTYYIVIDRDDDGGVNNTGRLTAYITTGDYYPGGTPFDTLTLDCDAGEQNDFRYIFATVPRGGTTSATTDGIVQDFNLAVSTFAELTASGGFELGGSAALTYAEITALSASGGFTFDGSAALTYAEMAELAASGGFALGGSAVLTRQGWMRILTDEDGVTANVDVAKVGGDTRTLHFVLGLYTGYTDS